MQEYTSDAIVLDKEPQGELDERVSVFAQKFGKFTAKVKSSRRPTSKLSPHLEPGNFVRVRFIEKGNLQIVDALKRHRLKGAPSFYYLLSKILAEGEPDEDLWKLICKGEQSWTDVLSQLGWNPEFASCEHCGRKDPYSFHLSSQSFFCSKCSIKAHGEKILV